MRGFVVGTIVTAIAFFILTKFLPQFVSYDGDLIGLVVISVVFGIVNGLIGPIVRLIALPISFMTLGLFGFVINGILLIVIAWIAQNLDLTFTVGDYPPDFNATTIVAAIVGAVVLGLVNSLAHTVVKD